MTATTIPGYTTLKNIDGNSLYLDTPTYTLVNGLLDQGGNVFLFGEAGVAKTELANAILRDRGMLEADIYQMETGAVSSGDQLDGERTLDTSGKLAVVPSELLKAVQSAAGGTKTALILDELNRVQAAGAVNKLLPLFSGQRRYNSDLDGRLEVGRNLQTIATANIGFHGTVRLNEALLDRFDPIEVLPITGRVLATMLAERFPTVGPKDITKIVEFSDQVRSAYNKDKDGDLRPISTRDAQRILRGVVAGLTVTQSITRLVGGQLQIQQRPTEAVDALVGQAKGKFGAA